MLSLSECSDMAYDLLSAEARQYPPAYMNWEHHLVEWWYESVYRTQFNSVSARRSQMESNQGQTDAADSSADDSVNRPGLGVVTLAWWQEEVIAALVLRTDPAAPNADHSIINPVGS
jgi:hypothetical protein